MWNGCATSHVEDSACGGKHHGSRCSHLDSPLEMENIDILTVIPMSLCSKVFMKRLQRTRAR